MLALRKIQPDVMFRARGIGNYGDYYTPKRYVPGGKGTTDIPWFVIYPLAEGFLMAVPMTITRVVVGSYEILSTQWLREGTLWSVSVPTAMAGSAPLP
jgi:hypothetical protein